MISQTTNSQTASLLQVEGVYAAYVKKEILCNISLAVHRGEIVTLRGENGSGKSTLLKTIAGLLHPTKGRIKFKSQDITNLTVPERQREGIGYLLQGGRVFPNLLVAENFEIAMNHHRNGHHLVNAQLGMIFPHLLEKRNVRAGLLSGGQRQMLAIEMVLAQEPEIALLDEPTGALSNDLATLILKTIRDYVQRIHCGVLLVEQNLDEALKVSDRNLRIELGSIKSEVITTINSGGPK
jgi:ABC-type branched-subunit amino acid transport system ATPase component